MTISPEYWAGLFDGEGCVYISKAKRTPKVRGPYQLCVEVRMTSEEPIRLLKEEFDGTITLQKARPAEINSDSSARRATFSWKVRSLKAKIFLEAIKDFTMVKRTQIDLALEFQEMISSRNHTGRIGLSNEECDLREKYYLEMRFLKTIS